MLKQNIDHTHPHSQTHQIGDEQKSNKVTPDFFFNTPKDTVTISSAAKSTNPIKPIKPTMFFSLDKKSTIISPLTKDNNPAETSVLNTKIASKKSINSTKSINHYILLLNKNDLSPFELQQITILSKQLFQNWATITDKQRSSIINLLRTRITDNRQMIQFIKKITHIVSAIADSPNLNKTDICDEFIMNLPSLLIQADATKLNLKENLKKIETHAQNYNLVGLLSSLSSLSTSLSNKARTNNLILENTVQAVDSSSDTDTIYKELDKALETSGIKLFHKQKPNFKETVKSIQTELNNDVSILKEKIRILVEVCSPFIKNIEIKKHQPQINESKTYLAFSTLLEGHLTKIEKHFQLSLLFYQQQDNLEEQALDKVRDKTLKFFYCVS